MSKNTEIKEKNADGDLLGQRRAMSRRFIFFASLFLFSGLVLIHFSDKDDSIFSQNLLKNESAMQRNSVPTAASDIESLTQQESSNSILPSSVVPKNDPVIGEGEFAAIVSASSSHDVLLRNKALNQLQMIAKNRENLAVIREALLGLEATDDAFAPLVAALGAVGSSDVQGMLCELVEQRRGDWRSFSAIIPVLGLIEQPSSETIEFLVAQSRLSDRDFSSTAALALGSIVHTLSKTDRNKGEDLLQSYINRIKDSKGNIEDIKESLAVLGNAGLPSSAEPILGFLNHSRADVRADAVMALRFMNLPVVENKLLARLEFDSDVEVRMRVVDALVHLPVSEKSLLAAKSILSREKSVAGPLREKVLDLFSHSELNADERQKLADWLTRFAENETDSAVRKKANSILHELIRQR